MKQKMVITIWSKNQKRKPTNKQNQIMDLINALLFVRWKIYEIYNKIIILNDIDVDHSVYHLSDGDKIEELFYGLTGERLIPFMWDKDEKTDIIQQIDWFWHNRFPTPKDIKDGKFTAQSKNKTPYDKNVISKLLDELKTL